MLVRLLGPVDVLADGAPRPVPGVRRAAVLAALALNPGEVFGTDRLVEIVWGDAAPATAAGATLYTHVSKLRQLLGRRDAIVARPPGYRLNLDGEVSDVQAAERLLREAAESPDPGERERGLSEALGLWRGRPLAELAGLGWFDQHARRLEQLRLQAQLALIEARLALGRHAQLIPDLEELARQHPLLEQAHGQFMLALYRAGRQADALAAYQRLRTALGEELGIDPSQPLRDLQVAILQQDRSLDLGLADVSGDSGPAGSTLPADTGAFTGRVREVQAISAAGDGQVLVIHAIAGMPGVGKTALAVHVAHRLAADFPDGQVFVDLYGYTAGREPAEPGDVLARLLRADGVHPDQLPDGVDARAALWRRRLAGRRCLLVLDNAASSAQVAPLLPASPGCLVLVTSRRFLGDLPAGPVSISLDVLAPDEAEQMFVRVAPRAADDRPTVAKLVAAGGFLPLAIGLLARLLARHPRWSVADLLAETESRLLNATAEHATVAAAFDLSYRCLPPPRQRLFRVLGVHPGTEMEPYAAAALAATTVAEAAGHLDALHADNLLAETGYRRYAMHDLIRSYAVTLAVADPAAERDATLHRLLDFYQSATAAADAQLRRMTRPATAPATAPVPPPGVRNDGPDLSDPDRALRWLRTERANLLACLARTGDPHRVVALTAGLTELLRRDGPWTQAIALHGDAVRAAAGLGDPRAHANALADLATMRRLAGDYPGAQETVRRALDLYAGLDDRLGQANALTDLAKTLSRTGDQAGAVRAVERALDHYRELGDRLGEAGALVELAVARGMTSDYRGARQVANPALELYRRLGHRLGQAYTLRILGELHSRPGQHGKALPALETALALYRALGNRSGEALTLADLGRAWSGIGEHAKAVQFMEQALARHERVGHRIGQAVALEFLGGALRCAGDLSRAEQALQPALALHRELGNRSGEASTLNEIGALRRLTGNRDQAAAYHRAALDLARLIDSPWDEAHALAGLGRCALAAGESGAAADHLGRALAIFKRIGAADAAQVAADLETLR